MFSASDVSQGKLGGPPPSARVRSLGQGGESEKEENGIISLGGGGNGWEKLLNARTSRPVVLEVFHCEPLVCAC